VALVLVVSHLSVSLAHLPTWTPPPIVPSARSAASTVPHLARTALPTSFAQPAPLADLSPPDPPVLYTVLLASTTSMTTHALPATPGVRPAQDSPLLPVSLAPQATSSLLPPPVSPVPHPAPAAQQTTSAVPASTADTSPRQAHVRSTVQQANSSLETSCVECVTIDA